MRAAAAQSGAVQAGECFGYGFGLGLVGRGQAVGLAPTLADARAACLAWGGPARRRRVNPRWGLHQASKLHDNW